MGWLLLIILIVVLLALAAGGGGYTYRRYYGATPMTGELVEGAGPAGDKLTDHEETEAHSAKGPVTGKGLAQVRLPLRLSAAEVFAFTAAISASAAALRLVV